MDPLKPGAADADRLLSQAHVYQMRGEFARAVELVDRAAELCPDNPDVWELKGDLLMRIPKHEDARDAYAKALELNPHRPGTERKHARAVFQIQERRFQREQMELMITDPSKLRMQPVAPRRPGLALLLAIVAPGTGQIYNGQIVKGAVLLVVMLVLTIFCLANPSFNDFIDSILHFAAGRPSGAGGLDFSVSLAMFLGFVVWAYGVADAVVHATRLSKTAAPSRPAPPADLDIEPPR